jgi:hypothetical protein
MTIKSIKTGWTGISALAGNPVLGDFESIQTVTVASTAAAIEFTSIPSSYTHLQVRYLARSTNNNNGGGANLYGTFNSDSANNYTHHRLSGNGTSASSEQATSQGSFYPGSQAIADAQATAGRFGVGVIDILDYTNTNKNTTVRILDGFDSNGSGRVILASGLWLNTAAITTIKFVTDANFAQYTHFALYGIR